MASILSRRLATFRLSVVIPVGAGLAAYGGMLSSSQGFYQAARFDAPASASSPSASLLSTSKPERRRGLDPDLVKELSGGSVSGFLAGVLVSVFSRTLVLLAGVAIILVQIASRYGINLVEELRVRDRVRSSRILAALNEHAAFKLSFGTAFVLSSFVSF